MKVYTCIRVCETAWWCVPVFYVCVCVCVCVCMSVCICVYESVCVCISWCKSCLIYKWPILWGDKVHVQRANPTCMGTGQLMDAKDQSYMVQRTTRCMYRGPICTYGDIMCIYAIRINVWGHYMRIQCMYKGPYNLMDVHRVNPMWEDDLYEEPIWSEHAQ